MFRHFYKPNQTIYIYPIMAEKITLLEIEIQKRSTKRRIVEEESIISTINIDRVHIKDEVDQEASEISILHTLGKYHLNYIIISILNIYLLLQKLSSKIPLTHETIYRIQTLQVQSTPVI